MQTNSNNAFAYFLPVQNKILFNMKKTTQKLLLLLLFLFLLLQFLSKAIKTDHVVHYIDENGQNEVGSKPNDCFHNKVVIESILPTPDCQADDIHA